MPVIKVATFNIGGSRNPEAVRALRRAHDIAIMGLQEVDINAERSHFHNVAKQIAGRDAVSAFSESMRFGFLKPNTFTPYKAPSHGSAHNDALYGVAIVSRLPILSQQKIALGPDEGSYWALGHDRYAQREIEPRSAIVAQLSVEGKPLWAISTHTAYTKDRDQPSAVRRSQIDTLFDFIDRKIPKEAPLVIMVDCNATRKNPDLGRLITEFHSPQANTYPVGFDEQPDRQIDYVFARGLEQCDRPIVIANPFVSDHSMMINSYRL